MDQFDYYVRSRMSKPDAVRRWAEIEGKSETMSDDLYRDASQPAPPIEPIKVLSRAALIAKFIAAIVQAWFGSSR